MDYFIRQCEWTLTDRNVCILWLFSISLSRVALSGRRQTAGVSNLSSDWFKLRLLNASYCFFCFFCYLGCSFPPRLIHAEILKAETCFEALWTNPTGLVVQGLWALCADGLQDRVATSSTTESESSFCFRTSARVTRLLGNAHRSAGLAVMFALGEVEALVAAFARLFLFVLFPGAFLEKESNKQDRLRNPIRQK